MRKIRLHSFVELNPRAVWLGTALIIGTKYPRAEHSARRRICESAGEMRGPLNHLLVYGVIDDLGAHGKCCFTQDLRIRASCFPSGFTQTGPVY